LTETLLVLFLFGLELKCKILLNQSFLLNLLLETLFFCKLSQVSQFLLSDRILKPLLPIKQTFFNGSLLLISLLLLLSLPLDHGRLKLVFHALEVIPLFVLGFKLESNFILELFLECFYLLILLLKLCKLISMALLAG
jgi:hypothetical protein